MSEPSVGRRVAIVTGASRGMGEACARELATRGYALALFARSDALDAVAADLGALAVRGSMSDATDLARLVDATLARYGRVDAVVCSNGHPAKGDLLTLSDDDWLDGVQLLLMSAVRLARLVTPVMERGGGGAFVHVSSLWQVEPHASAPVSSAVRAALAAFAKLYADRYAAAGIRMNCVLPGFIETYPVPDDILRLIPTGRPGTVIEIAKTVAFLVSDDARYITGQSLRVDGGLTRSI